MNLLRLLRLGHAYWRARSMKFRTRAELEAHQARRLDKHLTWLARASPYYSRILSAGEGGQRASLEQIPIMDKETLMRHFDEMNTAGLQVDRIFALARQAESSRDFSGKLDGYTVGLSSGTSATRGAFVVSEAEKAKWAGTMLAKMLPEGLFAGERVALFLRADTVLYQTVRTPWLSFQFFDLLRDFDESVQALESYDPTILVAPAQVLRALALRSPQNLRPYEVISVAEVLERQDREIIESAFGTVHEIYQATEGFLASTCRHGTLHLNEDHLHVEPEWIGTDRRRFVPIITDFSRTTQPIVRYRLNDVLVARHEACPCGQVTRAIAGVEGRCDDALLLPARAGGTTTVFADALHRILAIALPPAADYRLSQSHLDVLHLDAEVDPADFAVLTDVLRASLARMGVDVSKISWFLSTQLPPFNPYVKRRRITRKLTEDIA